MAASHLCQRFSFALGRSDGVSSSRFVVINSAENKQTPTVSERFQPNSQIFFSFSVSFVMADEVAMDQMLADVILYMEEEGVLSKHFKTNYVIKQGTGSLAFADLITTYLSDLPNQLKNLTQTLDQPVVDYKVLERHCMKIKGSTSCIGVGQMGMACLDLCLAVEKKSKEDCLLSLNRMKHEFSILQDKLEFIRQMELEIVYGTEGPGIVASVAMVEGMR